MLRCQNPVDAARRLRRAVRDAKGLPVTIRLLDPPLHEFLPPRPRWRKSRKNDEHRSASPTAPAICRVQPDTGFRGCCIAIAYPEIAEMVARAIFEAAIEANKVPAVCRPRRWCRYGTGAEFDLVKARIDGMKKAVMKGLARSSHQVGTMIECRASPDGLAARPPSSPSAPTTSRRPIMASAATTPRASSTYVAKGIWRSIRSSHDRDGVGELVKIGAARPQDASEPEGRICGEHGGDPPR